VLDKRVPQERTSDVLKVNKKKYNYFERNQKLTKK
jgi:hypothetical protein